MSARWAFAVGPWRAGASLRPVLAGRSGPQRSLITATSRSLTFKLIDPHEVTIGLPGTSDDAAYVEDLITDLWVWRDGVNLFRGRLMPERGDDLDDKGNHDTTLTFRDYRGLLGRRIGWTDRTWTDAEQSTIVWDAISEMQAMPGGNLGITKGTWPTTGVVRASVTRTSEDTVWAFIKRLSTMAGGFDLDIDDQLRAHLYYPRRGVDAGQTLAWRGNAARVRRTLNTDRYANAWRQSGADGVAPTLLTSTDLGTPIEDAREGRWDAAGGDTQLTSADMVAAAARGNLQTAMLPTPQYAVTVAAGAWDPTRLWLGDYVRVQINSGPLVEAPVVRIYEIKVDVDASDQDTVTITAGDVSFDARSVLKGISARLTKLEQR
jgi:hypothetical protein